jgi:hypothetical protein
MIDPARTTDPGGNARGPGVVSPPETPGAGTTGESRGAGAEPAAAEMGIPVPPGAKPNPRGGTLGTAIADITEPGENANLLERAKPIPQASRPSESWRGASGDRS